MDEYVASWSGGKDSCFAYWKAVSQGLKVSCLLNMVDQDLTKSMSHGLSRELIALQAEAMGMPIIQHATTWDTYESQFKAVLEQLKPKGINGLVCGDIYLQEHRDWIERVCAEVGFKAMLPLWQMDTSQLLVDFVDAGFKSIIVNVKADLFGKEWLGRKIDKKSAAELSRRALRQNFDPCGEAGEFHTFVYDGPAFKKTVEISHAHPVARDGRWFLEILEYSLD